MIRRPLREWLIDLVIVAVIVAIIVTMMFVLTGCSGRKAIAAVVEPARKTEVAPATPEANEKVEDAETRVNKLRGDLKTALADLDTAREEKREAKLAGIRALITWVTAICVLVGIVSVGAFIYWRMKSLLLVTAACGGMVIAGQASNILLDHPYIAGGGLLGIVGLVLLAFWLKERKNLKGLVQSVRFGHDMTNCDSDESAEVLKEIHKHEQEKLGVHRLICQALDQVKKS